MARSSYQVGDLVVFRKTKHSARPGRRARDVRPCAMGDTYSYEVDKFWIVEDRGHDDSVVLRTRRGKRQEVPATHPNLRHAKWWERLFWRGRFPESTEPVAPAQ